MKSLRKYQLAAIKEAWSALKDSDNPVLLEASVGSGKSIIIGTILKTMQDQNKRVLCLVNSAELVRNNSKEFKELGGNPSIFCASLSSKCINNGIVFATPQSVMSAIKSRHPIQDIIFNMIVVDEAHGIGNEKTIFMKILRHYKQQYNPMRILGLTGTAFRGFTTITGENAFFKTKVGNISTHYLIQQGFLVPPKFGLPKIQGFDFSKCKVQNTGEFKGSDLQAVIDSKKRLTWHILQEVQEVMKSRTVCMVFCSTKAHCHEALEALPVKDSAIILGDTPDKERNDILTKARHRELRYLISINCLLTGVNIPCLDLIVWLRPTSSLLLYIQGIGRGLRLHPGKRDCIVLDYAQNIDRFQDIDNPILYEAIKPRTQDDPHYCIECFTCSTLNKILARRCIGIVDNKRCDHYFEWKDCHNCQAQNDKTARICHSCKSELIDPNAKLKPIAQLTEVEVMCMDIQIYYDAYSTPTAFKICYNDKYSESYFLTSKKALNILYANYVRKHLENPSKYYMSLNKPETLNLIKENSKTPKSLILTTIDGHARIKSKIF